MTHVKCLDQQYSFALYIFIPVTTPMAGCCVMWFFSNVAFTVTELSWVQGTHSSD